jgi:hypothetical protein
MRRGDRFFDPALASIALAAEACGAIMLARRARDRRAEYRRRIELGQAAGKSRAEARGHGRRRADRPSVVGILGLPEREREARSRVHEALSIARQHPDRSPSWAAKRAGSTVDAVVRHAPGAIERLPNGRYRVKPADRELRVMPVVSGGMVYPRVAIRGSRQASRVGGHLAAISTYLEAGEAGPLRGFAGKTVTGTLPEGGTYRFELEADPDALAELAFSGELSDLVIES